MKTVNNQMSIKQILRQRVREILFILLLSFAVLMAGCSAKCEPQVIVRTEYKEVSVPVKCQAVMPVKPKFDKTMPQSAVDIAKYYEQTERLLKICIGDSR